MEGLVVVGYGFALEVVAEAHLRVLLALLVLPELTDTFFGID